MTETVGEVLSLATLLRHWILKSNCDRLKSNDSRYNVYRGQLNRYRSDYNHEQDLSPSYSEGWADDARSRVWTTDAWISTRLRQQQSPIGLVSFPQNTTLFSQSEWGEKREIERGREGERERQQWTSCVLECDIGEEDDGVDENLARVCSDE